MMTRPTLLAAAAALLAACSAGTAPGDCARRPLECVSFTAAISKTEIQLGDSATLRFVLRNHGADTVRLGFAMRCPVLPFIADETAKIVYPSGGGWRCLAVGATVVLAPGAEYVAPVVVRGTTPPQLVSREASLPGGNYFAYAELFNYARRTDTVHFSVVPSGWHSGGMRVPSDQ